MTDHDLETLIADTAEAARLHGVLLARLLSELAKRYGRDVRETGVDLVLDTLFTGSRSATLAEMDIAMSNAGSPPRRVSGNATHHVSGNGSGRVSGNSRTTRA